MARCRKKKFCWRRHIAKTVKHAEGESALRGRFVGCGKKRRDERAKFF